LTHALRICRSVVLALEMPCWIASSKLKRPTIRRRPVLSARNNDWGSKPGRSSRITIVGVDPWQNRGTECAGGTLAHSASARQKTSGTAAAALRRH
jgi:hypothetical protein